MKKQTIYKKVNRYFFVSIVIIIFFSLPYFVSGETENLVINRVETTKKVVALTFDADMTPKMLAMLQKKKVSSWYNKNVIDVLEKNKVPATLFLTGMWIETYPGITKKLSDNPLFELGNHSYSHPAFNSPCYTLEKVKDSEKISQITKTDELLQKNTSHYVKLFRFPGLCHDKETVQNVVDQGYIVIDGDIHGGDGFQPKTKNIVSNVVDGIEPGSIIVLHLNGGPNAPRTAEALSRIIKTLKKEGYTFVKVTELLKNSSY